MTEGDNLTISRVVARNKSDPQGTGLVLCVK